MEDNELLKKRFSELANRSYNAGIFTFTDFLGLNEQSLFHELRQSLSHVKCTAFGGVVGAERVILRFGDEEELGFSEEFPISTIKVEPVSEKFADKLTHRDFLGALLNLGIERSTLGDIAIVNNTAFIFAKRDIAPFIISELKRVKHTDVKLCITEDVPIGELYKTELRRVQLQSERIDALVAKAFSLSREAAQGLFRKKLIFVDGRLCESTSYTPKRGEVISVRGFGRLKYLSFETTSKKGKLNAEFELYT